MNPRIKENLDKYIHIHVDCIPVRGAKRSAFYDLTRNEITLFPSTYYDLLNVFKTHKAGEILNEIETEEQRGYFMEFIVFLIENEFIMFLEDSAMFPPIEAAWDMPCIIQNAIIDVDEQLHDFNTIFESLDALGCDYVQLRSFSKLLRIKDLDELLNLLYHKSIQRIELLLQYNDAINDNQYVSLMERHLIISDLTVHSSPEKKELAVNFGYHGELNHIIEKKIFFITEQIHSRRHCGIINKENFSAPSVGNFFENKLHNGCLNRKIAVDAQGEIRNCPSMTKSYGNIKNTTLEDTLHRKDFKDVWKINKDQIKACRDCEFRYICTDCRAYTENPEDLYSKPLKCGYDPYTVTWKEWTTNPLKEKAIKYYAMDDLVQNH